jgi:hypothetical protein
MESTYEEEGLRSKGMRRRVDGRQREERGVGRRLK